MAIPDNIGNSVRLDEMDADEFWDVARILKPSLTRAEFDDMWDEFLIMKALRRAH